ncbi:Hypothetical protein POVN_LOCUS25 [uncultured virus]|nr:Hypothetical protein POVN_LOCUS25 [uncultured virus]
MQALQLPLPIGTVRPAQPGPKALLALPDVGGPGAKSPPTLFDLPKASPPTLLAMPGQPAARPGALPLPARAGLPMPLPLPGVPAIGQALAVKPASPKPGQLPLPVAAAAAPARLPEIAAVQTPPKSGAVPLEQVDGHPASLPGAAAPVGEAHPAAPRTPGRDIAGHEHVGKLVDKFEHLAVPGGGPGGPVPRSPLRLPVASPKPILPLPVSPRVASPAKPVPVSVASPIKVKSPLPVLPALPPLSNYAPGGLPVPVLPRVASPARVLPSSPQHPSLIPILPGIGGVVAPVSVLAPLPPPPADCAPAAVSLQLPVTPSRKPSEKWRRWLPRTEPVVQASPFVYGFSTPTLEERNASLKVLPDGSRTATLIGCP